MLDYFEKINDAIYQANSRRGEMSQEMIIVMNAVIEATKAQRKISQRDIANSEPWLGCHGKFEGDIYRCPHGETGKLMDLVVRYNHGSFGLVRRGHTGMTPKRLASHNNQRLGEIIGNIYENPEILK